MPRAALFFAAVLILAIGPVHAHDFWIEPSKFVVSLGDSVSLHLREGQELVGNSLPYVSDWFQDFSRSDAQGREPVVSEMGDEPAAILSIRSVGTTLLGYRSTPDFVTLTPEKFEAYLRKEGMETILALRAKLGESDTDARENFVRCAKTYLTTNRRALRKEVHKPLGYTLELIPADNLHLLSPGDTLNVQLLYLGDPLAGALVTAFRKEKPEEKVHVRTDARGRASLNLSASGMWLVKAVHMARLEKHPKADWESYWASLLFELPMRRKMAQPSGGKRPPHRPRRSGPSI